MRRKERIILIYVIILFGNQYSMTKVSGQNTTDDSSSSNPTENDNGTEIGSTSYGLSSSTQVTSVSTISGTDDSTTTDDSLSSTQITSQPTVITTESVSTTDLASSSTEITDETSTLTTDSGTEITSTSDELSSSTKVTSVSSEFSSEASTATDDPTISTEITSESTVSGTDDSTTTDDSSSSTQITSQPTEITTESISTTDLASSSTEITDDTSTLTTDSETEITSTSDELSSSTQVTSVSSIFSSEASTATDDPTISTEITSESTVSGTDDSTTTDDSSSSTQITSQPTEITTESVSTTDLASSSTEITDETSTLTTDSGTEITSTSDELSSSTKVTSVSSEFSSEASTATDDPTISTEVTSESTLSGTDDSTTTDDSSSSTQITSQPTEITTESVSKTSPQDFTTRDLPASNRFFNGRNDFSIRNRFFSSSSTRIFTRNLNIFGETFGSFQIFRNGFISLNQRSTIRSIPRPTSSIRNFNFPIISPFWTNSFFDQGSDILYGFYSNSESDPSFYNSIATLINGQTSRVVGDNFFYPEIIYSFTWMNLHVNFKYRLSFQLFIVISNTQRKAQAIFNYVNIDWDRNILENVFIGLTDGKSLRVTNRFSSNSDSNGNPNLITNSLGNTGKIGIFVYDIVYQELDQCSLWYNNELNSGYIVPTRRLNFFFNCPAVEFLMFFNPFYNLYTGRKWQDARCYRLNSNVFFGWIIQQFCCYDTSRGGLILFGKDAGFAYNSRNIFQIISNGIKCCSDNNWNQCRKFYDLYPRTLVSRFAFNFFIGWGGGDPHITTFDGLSYTFNGLGKYIFSRSKKGTFEIQGETNILENQNGSASGTLFTSFAVKTNRSRIFQLDLVNSNGNDPYFNLFVDKSNQFEEDFFRNLNFNKEYNCKDEQNDTCTTIITSPESVQLIFDNGFSLNFAINTVTSNTTQQTISWISCSVNFLELNRESLFGDLEGLMGNFNENSTDDIVGRNGNVPKDTSEREIYSVCETWRVQPSEDIFVPEISPSMKARNTENYEPLFIDEIEIDPEVEKNCKGNKQCIFDASASGILDIGLKTANDVDEVETVRENKDLSPPIILFRENSTEINWYDNSSEIEITFEIIDTNEYNYTLQWFNITFIEEISENGLNTTITVRFNPIAESIPVIGITATDETNLTSSLFYNNFIICSCQSLSTENVCLYDEISETLDNTAFLVKCECSDYYEGTYCENIRNGCGNGNPCNIVSDFNQTCEPLEVEVQKSSNRSFQCVGPCPVGYVPDENGACIDDLECDRDPPVCKDNSTCIEKVGSFECLCEEGSFYRNETCQKIDYCRTSINNCDSICTSIKDGVECSCYPGFYYNFSTNTCEQNNTITDCECEQLCGFDSNGTTQCFCRNGFEPLNSTHCTDIKECQIDNGGCPETCIEKEGSFECSCGIGRKFNEQTQNCEDCEPEFYGSNCNQTCNCSLNSVRCDPVLGCVCNVGFDGLFCQDEIDGCEGIETNDILTCVSSYGNPILSCKSGFRLNNFTCDAIDICIEQNPCNIDANCTSVNGTFLCECQSGFRYNNDKGECEDIPECLEREVCEENSDCIELRGSYECACKNGFVSNSSDSQKPNCVRRDLETDVKTTTTEEVSSTNPQESFSTSSSLLNNSIVTTSSPSSTSSSNLLSSSTISLTFSSSSSTQAVPNNSSSYSTSTIPNIVSSSSTSTNPNIVSSSSTSTIPNNSSSSSTSTISNIVSSSSTSTIPNNSTLSSTSTIPNIVSSSSTSTIPNIVSSSSTSTIPDNSSSSSTSTIPNNSSLSSTTISTTLSTSSTKITTSSRKLNTDESSTSSLIQSLLKKFRIILVKILKLTLSQKRSLIVGETNLTNLETELIRSIPNSIFKGYRESNDIFIDANITTELNDDKTDINSFIQDVNKTLIREEDNFKRVAPSEFTLSIENDFEFRVFRINANGTEEEIDISDSNNSTIANNAETVSTTTLTSSKNSANYIPYKIGIYFIGMLYFINLILVN